MAEPTGEFMLILRKSFPVRWELHGRFDSIESAENVYRHQIEHRGLTAWAWWGHRVEGERMLADPNYEPKGEPL